MIFVTKLVDNLLFLLMDLLVLQHNILYPIVILYLLVAVLVLPPLFQFFVRFKIGGTTITLKYLVEKHLALKRYTFIGWYVHMRPLSGSQIFLKVC